MKSLCELRSEHCSDKTHSIVDFYESIPDYSDLYHLPEEDFYSKIETLRGTCCNLKEKCLCMYESKSISNKKKVKKSRRRRHHSESSERNNITSVDNYCGCNSLLCDSIRNIHDFYFDLEDFCNKSFSKTNEMVKSVKSKTKSTKVSSQRNKKIPITNYTPTIMKKNYNSTSSQTRNLELKKSKDNEREDKETNEDHDNLALSNYFIKDRVTSSPDDTLNYLASKSKIKDFLQVPSLSSEVKKLKKNKTEQNQQHNEALNQKVGLPESSNHNNKSNSSISSRLEKELGLDDDAANCLPAPRLNLAANLRISYIRNKYDGNEDDADDASNKRSKSKASQSEWNVRKNSAWKILKINKKGIDDILERLERRKIEEKYLQKEHELNMELMRQRVKSSPLLLEGLHDEFSVVKKHHCVKRRSPNNLAS